MFINTCTVHVYQVACKTENEERLITLNQTEDQKSEGGTGVKFQTRVNCEQNTYFKFHITSETTAKRQSHYPMEQLLPRLLIGFHLVNILIVYILSVLRCNLLSSVPDRDRDPHGHHQCKQYSHNLDYDQLDAFERPSFCRDSVDSDYNRVHDDAQHVNIHCCATLPGLCKCRKKRHTKSRAPVSDQ